MWKQPWRYIEGWTICIGIFITGIILQFSFGKIDSESFRSPVNMIGGALFLFCLLLFHLLSKRNKGLQWFAGHTAGITALTSLLLLVIIMGLTLQRPSSLDLSQENGFLRTGFMQMTVSWPFLLLSFYFLWILGLIVLKRLQNFKWKDTGFILNHAGLFIAFFAAILGSSDMQRLKMPVSLNETEWRATNDKNETVELPLAIELKSFTIDEYAPKLMLIDNSTGETLPKKKPVKASIETCPTVTVLLDWELEVTDYLPCAAVLINQDTVNCIEYHAEGATSALYVKARNKIDNTRKEGWVSCGNYTFHYASLRLNEKESLIMPDREPKRFISDIRVYTEGGEKKDALIEVNKPFSIAGWNIYQLSYEQTLGKWSRYSVFELVKDPWLPVVYTGIGMLFAGAVFLFILITFMRWKYKWILSICTLLSLFLIYIYLINPLLYNKTLMPALQSPWFAPHVIAYMLAYAVLGVATINALYLLIQKDKTEKQSSGITLCDNLVYVGSTLLIIGMLFGAIWAKEAWGHYWSWDPKETWAAITWMAYLVYIHFRLHRPAERKQAYYLLIFSFILLQICWFGVNYLPATQGNSVHVYS